MKHFGLGLFTLVFILGFTACQSGEKLQEADPFLHLSGQVVNSKEGAISIYYGEERQELALDSAGNFEGAIPVPRLGMVTVAHARTGISLYLGPGDRFEVNFDAEDFEATLAFTGDRLAENEYLLKKKQLFKASQIDNWMEVLALPFEEMIAKRDAAYDEVRTYFEAEAAEGKFSDSFVHMERAYFAYEPLLMELSYPDYYGYIHQIRNREEIPYPAKEVEKRLAAIPTDDPTLMEYSFYSGLLERFYGSVAQELMRVYPAEDRPSYQAVRWKVIDSLARHEEIRETLKFTDVKNQLSYRGPVHAEEIISLFEAENPSEKMMARLAEEKARWEPISPGAEVPNFSFTTVEGEQVDLASLKGQYVYIDIWATWCGPCIGEHPHWDKLKADYSHQPIAFLTVSIDDKREDWEKMVADKQMEGLQWFADGAWSSELAQHFMVRAIPRFLLLDMEGNVLDPSADRPSGKIREVLDELLEAKNLLASGE